MATKKYFTDESLSTLVDEIKSGDAESLSSAKSYTDTEIAKITNGTTVVPEAEHATSADTATKATQDASGNVITSTYETKTDASTKLTEAKTYSDTNLATAKSYTDEQISALLDGADDTTLDSIKELANAIKENDSAIDALNSVASGKADASHTHGNITNAGAIGTTSGKAVITTTNGVLTTGTVPIASGGTGATTAAAALTNLGVTATAAELNVLDGITATTTELNYMDGVTSNVQTQLDGKASNSKATTSASGLMSATDKTIVNCFTYDSSTPKLTIGNGVAQIILSNNIVEIGAAGGTVFNNSVDFYADVNFENRPTYEGEEIAILSDIPDYITTGAKSDTTIGDCATAEGYETTAFGEYSHAEGCETVAQGADAHAEGYNTTASGDDSHAEGAGTEAAGYASHAEGWHTVASGDYSHAGGFNTVANDYQYVVGRYNANTTAPTSTSDTTTGAGLFIVGIGTSDTARKNGFRVNPAGKVYGTGTFGTSGADYAEYFEWFDGNPNNEDRRGHFVTLEGDKIRYATPNDDYILGVVSADPSVAGDIHSEDWHNRYLKDVFGSKIVEVVEVEETTNEDGEIIPAHTERRWVLNPDYDPDVKYTSREERPEWAAIGIVGKLVVIDDGTCQVNGYCHPNTDGIATISQEKTNYRVMERLDDTHIRIFVR